MPKFRFPLQRVLELRLDEEEVKRRALVDVEQRRRALEDALRARQREISSGRDAWRTSLVGEIDAAALRHHATAAIGIVRKAQRTVIEMASLDKAETHARAELVEAARARRSLEILRERRLFEFQTRAAKQEREQLDEFAGELGRRSAMADRERDGETQEHTS